MKKEKSLKTLKKEADKIYSEYIRKKYSDKMGIVSCFTCDIKKPWKEQQNGHYISRNILSTRFCDLNCHVQCVACNVFKRGNLTVYAIRLQRRYGTDILEKLNKLRNEKVKYTKENYKDIIAGFKILTKDLR